MALSPRPWVALLALVALVAPRGTLVASKRQTCHLVSGDGAAPEGGDSPEPWALTVTNGEPWGHWGDPQFCPPGSLARGFQLKVQPYQGLFGDDTGLNGVRLLCDTGMDTVTSSVGILGSWEPPVQCPKGESLVSFRLRVEASVGLWDDAAATSMAGLCSGGSELEGGGLQRGTWGGWSRNCGPFCGVCGIRTRVEHYHLTDNSGLTDLRLHCCSCGGGK